MILAQHTCIRKMISTYVVITSRPAWAYFLPSSFTPKEFLPKGRYLQTHNQLMLPTDFYLFDHYLFKHCVLAWYQRVHFIDIERFAIDLPPVVSENSVNHDIFDGR